MGRKTLTGATQDAIVEITATDGMPLITVKLLIYKVDVYSLRQACAVWRISSASGLCWTTMVNELKVRAVHGQLNDGGFDSQRMPLPSINRSPAAFCRQVLLNEL